MSLVHKTFYKPLSKQQILSKLFLYKEEVKERNKELNNILPDFEINLMFPTGFINNLLHLLANPGVPQVDVFQFPRSRGVDALRQSFQAGAASEVVGG